ncbi:hypothetical protein [Sedimentibacter sp. MB31-C6]|uniref:hypothetical protein n=1 Tax=Sedimentibacter sp. MB31-C6 TaxID=3109366 RepID=UPI002DDD2F0A|nr:hypothetical protein [Sedimentibacter sp. MB36-C1]WSI04924.1 hypothetical protein U8307_03795 [Sedimentibacter sp. MB36-C1]
MRLGGSLVIIIFVVLCLIILATLSFTTTYSDLKLSNKTEDITTDYYYMHGKAKEKLANINDKLTIANLKLQNKKNINVSESENFNYLAIQELQKIDSITIIKENKDNIYSDFYISYEILGNLNQKINVKLNILYDSTIGEPSYEIISWTLSNIKLPSYDEDTYNLWEGISQ